MTDTWPQLLSQQTQLSNTPQASSNTPSYIPLAQLGILQVTGDDAHSFLQNLLTNDVKALAENQSQLTGFCNAKGRLFALFTLIRRHDHYQLVLPLELCELLKQRLSMYILRSKVVISNQSEQMHCIGLNNIDLAATELSALSAIDYQQQGRGLCIIAAEDMADFIALSQQQSWQLLSEKSWYLADIAAGLPQLIIATKEKFTPQQINLDLINGVSFSKGCYPGQEIVARLHYLGTPSRRLFIANMSTSQAVVAGEEISTQQGNIAGHIVNAQLSDTDNWQLLLSLKLSCLEDSLLFNAITIKLADYQLATVDHG